MNLKNKKNDEYIIIVGCGRLGASLANDFSEKGKDISIIDCNKNAFRKLSPSYGGLTILGDVTDINVIEQANPNKASTLICVTNNDNTNILVAQMAKELYKIENVVARLYDPERECVYKEFEIDTICPAILSANAIAKLIDKKEIEKSDDYEK